MINSISSGANQYSQMQKMQGPPPKKPDFDINGDSSVDETELASALEDINEKTGSNLDTDTIMSQLDTDEDGTINESEIKSLKDLLPPRQKPNIDMSQIQNGESETLLDILDSDDDDSVSSDELDTFLETLNTDTGSDFSADSLMEALDSNNDGSLNNEETENLKAQLPKPNFNPGIQSYQMQQSQSYGSSSSSAFSIEA